MKIMKGVVQTMNGKVGLEQVKAYAQAHNVDFKTAAKTLGLTEAEAETLSNIGGDLGKPVDGFQRKPDKTYTLKGGRKVEVYQDKATGKQTFKYYAADGTQVNEAYFMKATGYEGKHFAVNTKGDLVTVSNEPKQKAEEEKPWYEKAWDKVSGPVKTIGKVVGVVAAGAAAGACVGALAGGVGAIPGAVAGAAITLLAGGLTSCSADEPRIIDNSKTDVTVNVSVTSVVQKIDIKELTDAINNNNDKNFTTLMAFLKPYLDQILQNQTDINKKMDLVMDFVAEIIAKLGDNGVKLGNIENLINAFMKQYNIDSSKKDELLAKILNAITGGNTNISKYLSSILAKLGQNNDKTDTTNALLMKLINLVTQLGKDQSRYAEMILEYIDKMGFDMNNNFNAILNAINSGNAASEDIKKLLEKILKNQDANTEKILEALGKISTNLDKIDLSSIEKMLAALLEQAKKNGNILANIDAKTDLLNVTTKSILEALEKEFGKNDDRYKNIMNILTVISNKAGSKDDKELLDKLDKILQKLEEIKNAIKDHKVTVDVTGKITCNCNCGKNHEGILDDLNKILS